jgi:predicted Zn-dependent peptidase
VLDFNKHLSTVTPAAVQAAAKQYLTGKNVIKLVLLPENTK